MIVYEDLFKLSYIEIFLLINFRSKFLVGNLSKEKLKLGLISPEPKFRKLCFEDNLSSDSSHYPQEVLLTQFNLCIYKSDLKPHILIFCYVRTENNIPVC